MKETLTQSPDRVRESNNARVTLQESEIEAHVLEIVESVRLNQVGHIKNFTKVAPEVAANPALRGAYLRAVFSLARTHNDMHTKLRTLSNSLLDQVFMIPPQDLFDVAARYAWDERVPREMVTDLYYGIAYAMDPGASGAYQAAIHRMLDFTDAKHSSYTGHFLEFLRNLYNTGEEFTSSYKPDNVIGETVRRAIQEACQNGSGTYLLQIRARELAESMDGRAFIWEEKDRVPFEITRGRFAWHDGTSLHLARLEDADEVRALIADVLENEDRMLPPQDVIDAAAARGDDVAYSEPDPVLWDERKKMYKKLEALVAIPLSYRDLVGDTAASDDERAAVLHDFSYLVSKPVRETVERDFHIHLKGLSIQDQFKFLRLLKEVSYKNANPLLLEATRALWKSGVKDYLGEIRDGVLAEHSGGGLDQKTKQSILDIQEAQYAGKYPEAELASLKDGLTQALENPRAHFYVYRKGDEIASCVRFEEGENGVYMGSFLTNPKFAGGALGQAMLEAAIAKESVHGPIHAVCDPSLVPFYERFGFRLARGPYKDDHGVETCDIVLGAGAGSEAEPERKAA